jgi:hypothetical protein
VIQWHSYSIISTLSHKIPVVPAFLLVLSHIICRYDTGWWFQRLGKILVNWDDYSQYMENLFQTTNQDMPNYHVVGKLNSQLVGSLKGTCRCPNRSEPEKNTSGESIATIFLKGFNTISYYPVFLNHDDPFKIHFSSIPMKSIHEIHPRHPSHPKRSVLSTAPQLCGPLRSKAPGERRFHLETWLDWFKGNLQETMVFTFFHFLGFPKNNPMNK